MLGRNGLGVDRSRSASCGRGLALRHRPAVLDVRAPHRAVRARTPRASRVRMRRRTTSSPRGRSVGSTRLFPGRSGCSSPPPPPGPGTPGRTPRSGWRGARAVARSAERNGCGPTSQFATDNPVACPCGREWFRPTKEGDDPHAPATGTLRSRRLMASLEPYHGQRGSRD